jgi:hypothetical protein
MRTLYFLILSGFIFYSCDKKQPEPEPQDTFISLSVQPKFGAANLFLDSVYTTVEGYDFKILDFKFYMTDIKNNSNQLAEAVLYDFRENGKTALRTIGDPTKFTNLQGSIGVIESLNHDDPSAFPNESPLNISNAGPMHWGWNTGYIFIVIEGKADTLNDGNPVFDHSFSYHIGTDTYLGDFSFTNLTWVKNSTYEYELPLKFEFDKFLQNNGQNINLKTENLTHTAAGQQVLTQKVNQNFKEALKPF